MPAALEQLDGELAEAALDEVQPRARRRGELQAEPVMPTAITQRRTGRALDNQALVAQSQDTWLWNCLSVSLPAGLGLNTAFGLWWALRARPRGQSGGWRALNRDAHRPLSRGGRRAGRGGGAHRRCSFPVGSRGTLARVPDNACVPAGAGRGREVRNRPTSTVSASVVAAQTSIRMSMPFTKARSAASRKFLSRRRRDPLGDPDRGGQRLARRVSRRRRQSVQARVEPRHRRPRARCRAGRCRARRRAGGRRG